MEKTKLYCGTCKKEITHPWTADGCRMNGHILNWKPKIKLEALRGEQVK